MQDLVWKEASSIDAGDLLEAITSEAEKQSRSDACLKQQKEQAVADYLHALMTSDGLTHSQEQFAEALLKHKHRNKRSGTGSFSIPHLHRIVKGG